MDVFLQDNSNLSIFLLTIAFLLACFGGLHAKSTLMFFVNMFMVVTFGTILIYELTLA